MDVSSSSLSCNERHYLLCVDFIELHQIKLLQKFIGNRVIQALNLKTLRISVLHLNDIKLYTRSSSFDWKLNENVLEYLIKDFDLEIDISTFEKFDINSQNVKGKNVFVDISCASDLEREF